MLADKNYVLLRGDTIYDTESKPEKLRDLSYANKSALIIKSASDGGKEFADIWMYLNLQFIIDGPPINVLTKKIYAEKMNNLVKIIKNLIANYCKEKMNEKEIKAKFEEIIPEFDPYNTYYLPMDWLLIKTVRKQKIYVEEYDPNSTEHNVSNDSEEDENQINNNDGEWDKVMKTKEKDFRLFRRLLDEKDLRIAEEAYRIVMFFFRETS